MPRPTGKWRVSKTSEKDSLERIGSGSLTFKEFAEQSLFFGYDESVEITSHEKALELANRNLSEFEALSDLEIAQLNDAEHDQRFDKFRREKFGPRSAKVRFEAMLVKAQGFVPPVGGEHDDFSDYLIAVLQAKIAGLPTPSEPQKPNPIAFKAKRLAELKSTAQRLEGSRKGSAEDIEWLKKLGDALS